MAWTVESSGTQAIGTLGTNYTLATSTNNGTFVFEPTLTGLASGTVLVFRLLSVCLPGGSLEVVRQFWVGPTAVGGIVLQSPPIASDVQFQVICWQVSGPLLTFNWSLLRI